MSISRVNGGGWSGTTAPTASLTATQLDALDTNFSYAVDKRSGQTETCGSTITWSSGGITTSGASAVTCATDLTLSASSSELNLYGVGGAVSSTTKFPKIQSAAVSFTHFLSATQGKVFDIGNTIRAWSYNCTASGVAIGSMPYLQAKDATSSYGDSVTWAIPKIHGATLVSATAWINGSDTILPSRLPQLYVLKTTRSTGSTVNLYSGGYVTDPVTELGTYNLYHSFALTCDQNNTLMDLGNGDDYIAKVRCPLSSEAFNMKLYGLSVTYSVTRFAPAL